MTINTLTPNIMVEDLDETLEWYGRVFDAELVATLPPEDDTETWWAQVVIDDVTLMFQSRENLQKKFPQLDGTPTGGSAVLYLDVDDATALQEKLESEGVEIIQELHRTEFGRMQFAVQDCNEYILWFGEKITNEPKGPIVR